MRDWMWIVALCLAGLPCLAQQQDRPTRQDKHDHRQGPQRIASGEGYTLHGFFGSAHGPDELESSIRDGVVLLRTDTETGEMSWVLRTGTIGIPTRRASFLITRLIGQYKTDTHLVLVMYHSGRIWDKPPRVPPANGAYTLSVIELATGKTLQTNWPIGGLERGEFDRPKYVPDETLGEGVVKKTDIGFTVFNVDYSLSDEGRLKMTKTEKPDKPDKPAEQWNEF